MALLVSFSLHRYSTSLTHIMFISIWCPLRYSQSDENPHSTEYRTKLCSPYLLILWNWLFVHLQDLQLSLHNLLARFQTYLVLQTMTSSKHSTSPIDPIKNHNIGWKTTISIHLFFYKSYSLRICQGFFSHTSPVFPLRANIKPLWCWNLYHMLINGVRKVVSRNAEKKRIWEKQNFKKKNLLIQTSHKFVRVLSLDRRHRKRLII